MPAVLAVANIGGDKVPAFGAQGSLTPVNPLMNLTGLKRPTAIKAATDRAVHEHIAMA